MGMLRTLKILVLTAVITVAADVNLTVEQIVQFVKSSLRSKQPDRQVADYLKHVRLSERLDESIIDELQGLGAGIKTLTALKDLRDSSASLPPAHLPTTQMLSQQTLDSPDSIGQAKVLDAAREYAMNYEKQLPNFICSELTSRFEADRIAGEHGFQNPDWHHVDTITTKLTYFEHQEKYEVQMVNNSSVVNASLEKLGGAVSMGEFGSMMREVFEKHSDARFEWAKWATVRGRRAHEVRFDIDQPHSSYKILWAHSQELRPAYRGEVFIDAETNMIVRLVATPYDIPSTYPVQAVTTVVDFDFKTIGESEYLVPVKVVVTSAASNSLTRNEKQFSNYRKFGAETKIKFDTPQSSKTEK